MLINGTAALFGEKEIVKSCGAKSTASQREAIDPCQAERDMQIIITRGGLRSWRDFTAHPLCWSVSICRRGQKGHGHQGEHSPSRMPGKTQGWAVWWRQSWGCASGHRGPAAASCVPRGALQPSLRASTTLAAIAQSTGRERQGQLSWVTAKTEKERGKKYDQFPASVHSTAVQALVPAQVKGQRGVKEGFGCRFWLRAA